MCTAFLALGLCGLASRQARASASAGPLRIPVQHENGIQIYLRAGLHVYPQSVAGCSELLTEHGAVVTCSLHAPLAQNVDSTSPLVKGIADLTLRDEALLNMTCAVNPKIHLPADLVLSR